MGLLMALARPQHAARILGLQASANREAAVGYHRALADLSHMQEAAEIAERLAGTKIEPSAAIRSAEDESRAAEAAAKAASAAAIAAADLYHEHLAKRPTGWKGLIAWASGALARHDAREVELRVAKTAAEDAVKLRDRESRASERRLQQATEAHDRDAADLRKTRRQDADAANLRSEAATRALTLLDQKPALANMGVETLLQLGRCLLSRECASAPDLSVVLKPAREFVPT